MSLHAILDEVPRYPKHVVITGGEPTMQDNLIWLVTALRSTLHHVTVETNGLIWPKGLLKRVDLLSISPKLPSSGHKITDPEVAMWRSMLLHAARVADLQFKFVIDPANQKDIEEAENILNYIGQTHRYHEVVWQPVVRLLPGEPLEKERRESINAYLRLIHQVRERRLPGRVLPQMHKIVWGSRKGV